jgi:hypothetical protein
MHQNHLSRQQIKPIYTLQIQHGIHINSASEDHLSDPGTTFIVIMKCLCNKYAWVTKGALYHSTLNI